jgi:hypothetical protein
MRWRRPVICGGLAACRPDVVHADAAGPGRVKDDFASVFADVRSNIVECGIKSRNELRRPKIDAEIDVLRLHIPVYRNINLINPIRFLADGRPVYNRALNSLTRFDPRFNNILMVESAVVSTYDSLTLQLTKRFSRGLQFSANYTLSKATDDAPEQNMTTGNIQGLVLSDPTNRALDKGNSFADQRHTFVMSLVARPQFDFENKSLRYLFNHNQVGIIAAANSGETFNIISNLDLNGDGVQTSDRPVGVKRNSGTTPPQFNVDLRYSRFFNLTERYKLEVFGEFVNLFNINSIVQFNNVTVTTNADGELVGGLPDFRGLNQSTSQDSRQFQLGFKFIF